MTVNVKHKAIRRPTNTISDAWCCSGVLFTRGLCKTLVLDICFRNCATTTTPNYYCYKQRVANKVTPFHSAIGCLSVISFPQGPQITISAGSSNGIAISKFSHLAFLQIRFTIMFFPLYSCLYCDPYDTRDSATAKWFNCHRKT